MDSEEADEEFRQALQRPPESPLLLFKINYKLSDEDPNDKKRIPDYVRFWIVSFVRGQVTNQIGVGTTNTHNTYLNDFDLFVNEK